MSEFARDMAIKLFVRRAMNHPQPIDNSKLYAGSPMIFYCKTCGWVSDIKEEEYCFAVRHTCSECDGLTETGWMTDALQALTLARNSPEQQGRLGKGDGGD